MKEFIYAVEGYQLFGCHEETTIIEDWWNYLWKSPEEKKDKKKVEHNIYEIKNTKLGYILGNNIIVLYKN